MKHLTKTGFLGLLLVVSGFSECDEQPARFVFIDGPQGTTLTEAQTVTFTARQEFSTGDGLTLVGIDFYRNGDELMGTDDTRPFTYAWTIGDGDNVTVDNGTHRWHAEAVYEVGGVGTRIIKSDALVYQVAIPRNLPPPPPSTPGVEAVCSALGGACTCSEPLDVFQVLGQGLYNPIDSTDKECGGIGAVYSATNLAAVNAFGMPAGSSVEYVWRTDYGRGGIATVTGNSLTLTEGTVCTRLYQRLSSDYPRMGLTGNGAERNKVMEMGSSEFQFQSEFFPPSTGVFSPRGYIRSVGYDARLSGSGPTVTTEDCKSSWCRFEQCTDRSGSTVTFRTRVTVLDSGKVLNHTSGGIHGVPPLSMEPLWIGNLYREVVYDGSRFLSHAMQAEWPNPAGQWIGPACEVEGTSEWGACP